MASSQPPSNVPPPVVGDWYRRPDGPSFEVVAYDDEDGTIEIQHADGTLEELDFESWNEQTIDTAVPPDDWSGPLEIEREDLDGVGSEPQSGMGEVPRDPLDVLDRDEAFK